MPSVSVTSVRFRAAPPLPCICTSADAEDTPPVNTSADAKDTPPASITADSSRQTTFCRTRFIPNRALILFAPRSLHTLRFISFPLHSVLQTHRYHVSVTILPHLFSHCKHLFFFFMEPSLQHAKGNERLGTCVNLHNRVHLCKCFLRSASCENKKSCIM